MDAESVEPFLVYLPIPQRVVVLVLLGLWLWTWFLKVSVSYYDVSKVIVSNESTGLPYFNTSTKIHQSSLKLFKSISRVIIPWQLVCIILFQYSFTNNAVSYTHLDGYKRQVQASTGVYFASTP